MKSSDIREAFLAYFEKNGHMRVKSSSLIPANDPTLFFTNAGMVQFKDVFTGSDKRPYRRATTSQKCMRVSGKHNDLESVGHTPRHHTFFEMLGNFSFGDYFKKDAIAFAWEFLTKEMKLDPKRLIATVFREDDEAEGLWLAHVPKDRIFRLDEKDNFWSMGETGPCGPCSEILWDFGAGPITRADLDTDRFMEIWNLVFMQFNRDKTGKMEPLAAPSIDTGMGLERLSAVMQGKRANWESDLFKTLIDASAHACKVAVADAPDIQIPLRVIADHIRCSTFLISDGVIPSNEGRGYVLRRIIRRAVRYGKRLGQNRPFLAGLVKDVVHAMRGAYPELVSQESFIQKVVAAEEERFIITLDKGLELLEQEMNKATAKVIAGDVAFKLYDTFGFPLDVTQMIADERGFEVDVKGFENAMSDQKVRARASWKGSGEESVSQIYRELSKAGVKSQFVGYLEDASESEVIAIIADGNAIVEAGQGAEVQIIAARTPFYGESGGQTGDKGRALGDGVEIEITDVKRPLKNLIVHLGKIKRGTLRKGDRLSFAIDIDSRQRTRCNHTATHLIHRALREILGEHVKQAGSLVTPTRLRFDFSHFQALTDDERNAVERDVNLAIRRNLSVVTHELTHDEAVARGALAFFGDKYEENVRMVDVAGHSMELCGGTHVSATGEIGMMKIISESSVAAGVRRIEAVTGLGVEDLILELENERIEIARSMKVQPSEIGSKAVRMMEECTRLEKELKKSRSAAAGSSMRDLMTEVKEINGVKLLAAKVEAPDRDTLGGFAEQYRDKLGEGVVVLGSEIDGKVVLIAAVSKGLTNRINAGAIIKKISEIVGGKGGGRADFAQGGGADPTKLDAALRGVEAIII